MGRALSEWPRPALRGFWEERGSSVPCPGDGLARLAQPRAPAAHGCASWARSQSARASRGTCQGTPSGEASSSALSCAEVREEGLGTGQERGGLSGSRACFCGCCLGRGSARPLPPAPGGRVPHSGSAETACGGCYSCCSPGVLGSRVGDGHIQIASGPLLGTGRHTLQPSPASALRAPALGFPSVTQA